MFNYSGKWGERLCTLSLELGLNMMYLNFPWTFSTQEASQVTVSSCCTFIVIHRGHWYLSAYGKATKTLYFKLIAFRSLIHFWEQHKLIGILFVLYALLLTCCS